jgi:hypothetical protein
MRTFASIAAVASIAMGLSPLSAFAATATTDVSEDDILKVMEEQSVMTDERSSMYYPGPYGGGGISVDATVTEEVTPDFVAVSGYCEVSNMDSRDEVRTELSKIFTDIKADVGSDGRVRRSGTPSVYPFYDTRDGMPTDKMSGSINIFIRVVNVNAAQRISDILDEHSCSPSWDVRLVDTEDHETALLDQLISKVNKRKAVYEKLLSKKLTDVSGVSLSTWVDGWSSYDPETNKADATTTLSIMFDIGSGARVTPLKGTTRATPKG